MIGGVNQLGFDHTIGQSTSLVEQWGLEFHLLKNFSPGDDIFGAFQ